ncbi:multidrug effflux MFS transporter [Thermobifida halotolerans]|uniref:Multidrug effflux MFS transporter n=1 Tax=Thermobifida halotolerans TaxID=483545 RepID=A0AA97M0W2_9ACTN|nr:multidrug effflux MFS transporter [Thermobifida halotolerans]
MLAVVLGVLAAAGPLSTDLYLPAFPMIAEDLGTTEARVQLTLTASMVGLALGQLAAGPMSDAWGRRGPLLVGTALFMVTSLLCMLVSSVEVFVAIRFVQGVAGAAGAVISHAVVRDLYEGDAAARFFSRLMLVSGMAPIVGPVLGGQLLLVGPWPLSFAALAAVNGLGFLAVLFLLPETLPRSERRSARPGALLATVGHLLRDLRFVGPALALGLNFGMIFVYISSFSFVSQNDLGASPQTFSLLFAVNAVAMLAGTQLNGLLIGRIDTSRRLVVGLALSLGSVAALAVMELTGTAVLVTTAVALAVMMFGTGMVFPNATTLALSSQTPSVAGTASALMGSSRFAFGGLLAAVAGMVAGGEATLASMVAVMAATGATALVAFAVTGWLGRRAAV